MMTTQHTTTSARRRLLLAGGVITASALLGVGLTGCSAVAIDDAATPPAAERPVEKPAVDVEEPAVDAEVDEPSMTVSQEQAVRAAESYLEYTAFSRSGLIEQLEYEGFDKADAKFAVGQIDVDWKEQAAKSAESYLEYTAFSRSGLIEQLEYEGFTTEQAEHGADAVGL